MPFRSDCNDPIDRVGEELEKRTLMGRFGKLCCLGKPIRSFSSLLKMGTGSVREERAESRQICIVAKCLPPFSTDCSSLPSMAGPIVIGARLAVDASTSSIRDSGVMEMSAPNQDGSSLIRVLIVHPTRVERVRLTRPLRAHFGRNVEVFEASEAGEAEELLSKEFFDVALVAEQVEGHSGLELAARLTKICPDTATILVADKGHTRVGH